jgi:K+-transporting ATPase ATPase C chain
MDTHLRPVLVVFGLLSLVTGVVYPLAVTAVAQLAFSFQAEGSIIESAGQPVGSNLIGQPFSDPKYFWGRPSATRPQPYNGASSSGSNMAPTNPELFDAIRTRYEALRQIDPGNTHPVPVDLVTASGSGLDPHISPAAAEYQVARVARVRGLRERDIRAMVALHTEERTFGVLGERRVNVLALNRALDATHR